MMFSDKMGFLTTMIGLFNLLILTAFFVQIILA